MIDKSIRQYQQLVQPGTGRPGYAGTPREEFEIKAQKQKEKFLKREKDLRTKKSISEEEIKKGTVTESTLNKRLDELGIDRMKVNDAIRNAQNEFSRKVRTGEIVIGPNQNYQLELDKVGTNTKKGFIKEAGGYKEGQEMIAKPTIGKKEMVSDFVPDEKNLRDPDRRNLMDRFADYFLASRIPGGRKTVERVINIATGKEKLSDIPSNYLASYQGKGPFQAALQAGRTFNLGKNLLGSGKGILSAAGKALPILGAGAGIAYLHKNRERFTGYATQKEYDDARDLRILETRRADMLQRKEEGKSYSDKNLGDVTREIAKKKGLDILNPNEMRNIDKDIEEWGENYGFDDSGSFTGEGFGDSSGPSEDYGFDDSGNFTGEGLGGSPAPPAPTHYDEPR
jgi:ribosomal protein L11